MTEAADAKHQSKSLQNTAFVRAAKYLETIFLEDGNAKKFSVAAFKQSSGRVPKSLRPKFPAQADLEPAVAALQERYPTASIGSLRKTIEIYDPQGSLQKFETMLDSPEMKALLLDGKRGLKTDVAVVPKKKT